MDCGDHVSVTVRGEGRQIVCEECTECTGFSEEISKLMIQSLSDDAVFEEEDGMLKAVSFGKSRWRKRGVFQWRIIRKWTATSCLSYM